MNRDFFVGEELPDFIFAPRTDAIYNAHGYLTKVPVDGILPYLNRFTSPGDTVVDLFAGSGMTAVAAKIAGRNAVVSDISVLGKHIGEGYLTDVDAAAFAKAADAALAKARHRHGALYETVTPEGATRTAVRTIWSFVYRCSSCTKDIVYFEAMRANKWEAPATCPHCNQTFSKRSSPYVGDVPVVVVVEGADGKQIEVPVSEVDRRKIEQAEKSPDLTQVPSQQIASTREMYRRSALGKWRLDSTKNFFSARNALALYYLREAIRETPGRIGKKLLFAFTAILPRASRRYQWSLQRPLNAATQTYYIAPVYYEWNVFDLFARKVRATSRADEELSVRRAAIGVKEKSAQRYVLSSAAKLEHLMPESVDYVFTDPPFGSNLFYADMSLFHEAWLGATTDDREEAVIHTNGQRATTGADERYESLLRAACNEAFRVLKPGKCLSLVFGNSSGRIWSMVQNILMDSGFEQRPVHIGILDKGQRSVKGLASGFESVSTLDLILTIKKPASSKAANRERQDPVAIGDLVEEAVQGFSFHDHQTPSHLYLTLLKQAFERGLPVEQIHLSDITDRLRKRNIRVHSKTGEFVKGP